MSSKSDQLEGLSWHLYRKNNQECVDYLRGLPRDAQPACWEAVLSKMRHEDWPLTLVEETYKQVADVV